MPLDVIQHAGFDQALLETEQQVVELLAPARLDKHGGNSSPAWRVREVPPHLSLDLRQVHLLVFLDAAAVDQVAGDQHEVRRRLQAADRLHGGRGHGVGVDHAAEQASRLDHVGVGQLRDHFLRLAADELQRAIGQFLTLDRRRQVVVEEGDQLLEALVGCAGVTLSAVATAMSIPIKGGTLRAEGDLDFRGTLGVAKDAPVGFAQIRLTFDVETDAPQEKLDQLLKLTERYCVVYQTIKNGPKVSVSMQRM